MSQQTKSTDNSPNAHPRRVVFSKRLVLSYLVLPLLPGVSALIIGGNIISHDVQFAFFLGPVLYLTQLNYLFLPITLIVLLKKGVHRPIPLMIAVGFVYGGLFLLLALFGFLKFSLLWGGIVVASGGVSGLLFWVMGIWQRKSSSDKNLAS